MNWIVLAAIIISLVGLFVWSLRRFRELGENETALKIREEAAKQETIELKAYEAKLQEIDEEITVPNHTTFISASDASHVLSGETPKSTTDSKT